MSNSKTIVPWEDLSDQEKENVRTYLYDLGITVSTEEAAEYYGNPEKVEADSTEDIEEDSPPVCPECFADLTIEGLLLGDEPGFCPECGAKLYDGKYDPDEHLETITIRITPDIENEIEIATELLDMSVEEFCREAIRTRIQALAKVVREYEN